MNTSLPPARQLSELLSPEAFRAHEEAQNALDEKKRSFTDVSKIDPATASVDELRFLVKHLITVQVAQAQQAQQPLGIDIYSNLPVHFDPPECPVCMEFKPRPDENEKLRPVCHDCNELIPYEQELLGHGLEAATIQHLHLHTIPNGGGQIRSPYRRELCRPCYRIDFEKDKGYPCPF